METIKKNKSKSLNRKPACLKKVYWRKGIKGKGERQMWFKRMVMEKESPEEWGYEKIKFNLTESSVTDCDIGQLDIKINNNLLLCYGDHSGMPELRELIAREYDGVCADQVLISTGACMALFIAYATLLKPQDHVVIIHPNYASNIEVPKSLGCNIDLLRLHFEDNFRINLDELKKLITPKTRLVNITYPHNPTGIMISESTLRDIIKLVEENDCYLLVDETYRGLTFGEKLPTAVSLSPRAISVESVSKTYGIPGVRTGWLVTKDRKLKEAFLATKEQICICGSIVDENITYQVLKNKDILLANFQQRNKKRFEIIEKWINSQDDVEWIKPQGGVVCFPRIKPEISIDTTSFYRILNEKYGTFIGPGHWFEMDDRYFRIGYGWPSEENLTKGLRNITKAIWDLK